jgi:NADH-quinone oxidoreductase subunit G
VSNGDDRAKVTINGQEVETTKGRLLIDVAEEMGIFVPRFCYHPGMKSVAVCRMCLVSVEGQPKLLPACATPVADGMVVDTEEADAVDAQKGMLEFLLINHPLDCPICDRTGECPLQDQTYAHGPGSSRYIEPKRTYEKALEISDLVVLDRERCVLCWRCVRFADEVAGDRFIQLVDRGAGTQILTFSDEPFDSYFSGNTIQICPVGALTSKPYRFVSRPWDLETAPSVCTYCSVGCSMTNESRDGKVVRCQALPNEQVNDFWICDKGRYGYHHVDSNERLETPLHRGEEDSFEPVRWGQALRVVAEALEGKERIGVIAGGHLTTEDAFAISRLARKSLKTNDVDSRIQDAGAPYEYAKRLSGMAGSSASIDDLDAASTIVWVGPDPKETLPVLYLRLRKAVIDGGAKLVVFSPRRISLEGFATDTVRLSPDELAGAISAWTPDEGSGGSVVVCWGPASPGADESDVADAAVGLAAANGGKLLVCPPHAGSQGMLDMGVHPAFGELFGLEGEGKDTRAILEAAAAGELDVLLIFGADPIADFPDAALARRALESSVFTVVVELFPTDSALLADVVLPSAAYAEREGTFTNLERRLQKLEQLVPPPGSARAVWGICRDMAKTLGDDWGWTSFADVWAAIRAEIPTHADVDPIALAQEMYGAQPFKEAPFGMSRQSQHVAAVAGPGGQYPKGYRSGAPFQTGQNWPLSWELRAFEARQRPGIVPSNPRPASGDGSASDAGVPSEATPFEPPRGSPVVEPTSSDAGVTQSSSSSRPIDGDSNATGRSFVLLSGRFIYDDGAMVARSAALHGLARKPFVEVSEGDAKRLGFSEGDEVVVRGSDHEARLEVRVTDIAEGVVFVPYDQPGLGANRLMSGPNPRVEVSKS